MQEKIYQQMQRGMAQLLPLFSPQNTLQQCADALGAFLAQRMPLLRLAVLRFGSTAGAQCDEAADWSDAPMRTGALSRTLLEQSAALLALAADGCPTQPEEHALCALLGVTPQGSLRGFMLYYGGRLCGMLVVQRAQGAFSEIEQLELLFAHKLLEANFSQRAALESVQLNSFVFNQLLDSMHSSIYITDVETDRILFMNQAMKRDFGLELPEGKVCWRVLQKGMDRRCSFCPVGALCGGDGAPTSVQWEETNTRTGRVYQNYDSLIRWLDGRTVHLQHSMDITQLKHANTDELTHLLARRPGKTALRETLRTAREEGRTVTVCLYDINLLKEVNDLHGHAEGDRLICTIADAVKAALREQEYAFRLSGDEFVVVLLTSRQSAHRRIEEILDGLRSAGGAYEMAFCYGLLEIDPAQNITLEEALFLADERMYEQKRRFHILTAERRRPARAQPGTDVFEYDASHLYDALVQSTDDYLYVCNMKTGLFRYPRAMVEEFDLPAQVLADAASVWGAKVHPDDHAAFLEANQEIVDGHTLTHCVEYRAKNRRGEWVWLRCRGRLELDENSQPVLFAGFITNLGKRNAIDHLTGLYNKLEFEEQITQLLGGPQPQSFGVMVLGVDDLRHINDLYDRYFGDEVLRVSAQRLRTLLPADAFLYRLDGDEFGILLRAANSEAMERLYRSIANGFGNKQELYGKKYHISFSGGALLCPADADNYQDIIKYANYSMEYAKRHGKKHCVPFSKQILSTRARTLQMVEALRESAENGFLGFSLCFQPLVEPATGRLLGAEALARWQHPLFGQVSPVEFIPLLEQTGLIVPVGKWILQTAMQLSKPWCSAMPNFFLDVNLSYHQLERDDFVSYLRMALQRESYPAKQLVMEMTESHFAREGSGIQEIFRSVREMGVRIAMDDFGTGYSALGILKHSPADIVKIDRAFVQDIAKSSFDTVFIRAITDLCHAMQIAVCLEGVETETEYAHVSDMGLDMMQGYLFSKPLTVTQFQKAYFE